MKPFCMLLRTSTIKPLIRVGWALPTIGVWTFSHQVILDCAHFLDLGHREYDNAYAYEHETRGRVGWALPTLQLAWLAFMTVGGAHPTTGIAFMMVGGAHPTACVRGAR